MALSYIYTKPDEYQHKAEEAYIKGIASLFPIVSPHYTLVLSNIHADRKPTTLADEKDAILRSKSMTYPIKGDLQLILTASGKVVDKVVDYPLAQMFNVTSKYTMVYSGTNYSVANQLQLLEGAYTRTRDDGILETHFNTGTGNSFSIELDPESNLFYVSPRGTSSKVLLLPFLTLMGVSPSQIEASIGKSITEKNIAASVGKEDSVVKALYSYLVPRKQQVPGLSVGQMKEILPSIVSGFSLNKKTTAITLGREYSHVSGLALLDAVKKMVQVYKGEKEEDNRDSLAFKRVQSLPDFIRTQFTKGASPAGIVKKIIYKMETSPEPKIKYIVAPNMFSRVLTDFLLTSSLAYSPTETNPLESIENVGKVTVLGEGGISSERGVPASARSLDPSHFGLLDLNRTPESGHAGIDLRFTNKAARDEEGNMYVRVRDKNGKISHISTQDVLASVVAFPGETGKTVRANIHGTLGEIDKSKVDYWYADPTDFYSVTTSLIPFMNSDHPNRLTMAGKALPQALALKHGETPLVQSVDGEGNPYAKKIGRMLAWTAREPGIVKSISDGEIIIKGDNGGLEHYSIVKNLPFNQKGFLDATTLHVKVGDHVKKGQLLADSNYTKNGDLALGLNLNVAYMPYKGFNFEDGIVISQSAAEKLVSSHFYVEKYEKSRDTVDNKNLLVKYFSTKFTPSQLANLDSRGYALPDKVLHKGDPIIAVLEKREPTPDDLMLGRLHKTLVRPFRLVEILWEHEEPGKVVDVFSTGKVVKVSIRSEKAAEVGDKLTGLHGNKGVITQILPNEMMPYTSKGEQAEVLLNPASVTSRINLGQLLETAAAKVAKKTGSPYLIANFKEPNNLSKVRGDLKKHGLSESEEMINPETGKPYNNKIFFGPQYIIKMNKTTDQNYSARNIGSYDADRQPTKGGSEGSKGVGFMEFLSLLGSDARQNLKEIGTTKSEHNSEYWTKFVRGEPLPIPNTTFATKKLFNMLTGAGLKTTDTGHSLKISPLLDKDILSQSAGEIKKPLMIEARNLQPEKGGLFDPVITGGLKGQNWTHYTLAEPVLNPAFERAAQKILGITSVTLGKLISGEYKVVEHGKTVTIVDETGKPVKTTGLKEMEEVAEDLEEEA